MKINIDTIIRFLTHANQLKTLPRTGWLQRGVPQAENIAAHSHGVVLCALLLCELIEESVNVEKVLAMATLHDLPESLTSDIPSPVKRFFPMQNESIKRVMERNALAELLADLPFESRWQALWAEFEARESAESKLTHDADKLDLYMQAYIYEQTTSNRRLAEFWTHPHPFYFKEAQAIYAALRERCAM